MSSSYTMLIPFLLMYLTSELGVGPEYLDDMVGIVFSSSFLVSAIMAPIWAWMATTKGQTYHGDARELSACHQLFSRRYHPLRRV